MAIIRLSGPRVRDILAQVAPSATPLKPRYARRAEIYDVHGTVIDDGLVLYFPGPASATGEDVAELHLHGSPLIAELVLRALLHAGARLAGPGEFTKRAFLNGKLDLSAAEAVGDLIAAEHESAVRAASARLGGAVARDVERAAHSLRVLVEELAAAVDFPDEVPDPERNDVKARLEAAVAIITQLLSGSVQGKIMREGASIAIIGPPNAGKSSLLNALLGEERALVSPIAGTTRDTIEESLELDGVVVRFIDTAGIRAETGELEAAGIARSRAALARARLALVVIDGAAPLHPAVEEILIETRSLERVVFFNKADAGRLGFDQRAEPEHAAIHGSTRDPATVARVGAALREQLVGKTARIDLERPTLSRTREIDAAYGAVAALRAAQQTLVDELPLDLLVGDLHDAIASLGKISGATVSEEMLDAIFLRFCIGK